MANKKNINAIILAAGIGICLQPISCEHSQMSGICIRYSNYRKSSTGVTETRSGQNLYYLWIYVQ